MPDSRPTGRPRFSGVSRVGSLQPVVAVAVAVMALLLASGCGDGGTAGNAFSTKNPTRSRPVEEFAFINRGDIITLDLNQMSYLQDFRISYATREGLYTYDPATLDPIPSLAASHTLSDDKRVWTFTLQSDGRWSNGDPVTAHDFVFSWRNLLESPGEYTSLLYYIKGAEAYEDSYRDGKGMSFDEVGVKAVDDRTLVVTLTDPVPFFPDLMAFPTFYPRHAKSMERFKQADAKGRVSYDPAYTRPPDVVLNGPFVLKEWTPGKQLVLERNPQYRAKDQVKSERIVMIVNNDPQSAFVQYEAGEVDWMADVAPEIGFNLKQQGRQDLKVVDAYGTAFLTFNCGPTAPELGDNVKNPLADQKVRQALAMTVDKNQIVNNITRMGEKPANWYVPAQFFKGWKSKPAPSFDVEGARKLLAEAGYPEGKGFPALSICYNSESPVRKDMAEFLRNQWRRHLGINVELRAMELKGYRNYVTNKQYTVALVAWYGDYKDPSTWTDKYHSRSLNNDSNWGPPEYDALLARAAKETDEAKRFEMLMEAESMINTQLPIVPLYYYVNFTLQRDWVRGLIPNAKNITIWNGVHVVKE